MPPESAPLADDRARVRKCLEGDAAARREVIVEIERAVARWARRNAIAAWQRDEFSQAVVISLLGFDGSRPKLAGYSGRAPLAAWLTVACTRACLNLFRGVRQKQRVDAAWERPTPSSNSLSRRELERVLKTTLTHALAAVGADVRVLLGLQYIEGLDGVRIAKQLGIHRVSVVRRQKAARAALRTAWLEALRAEVGSEAEAVLNESFDDQLSLSLPRLLR